MTPTITEPVEQILIQDSLGRVRTPRERREVLLEEYERSGMSGIAFAEKYGIKYTTLASWIQKKKKQSQGDQKAPGMGVGVQWVEAVVPEQRDYMEQGAPLIVRIGGAEMEVADRKGAMLAVEVLRQLGGIR
jgi:transposase-like protein